MVRTNDGARLDYIFVSRRISHWIRGAGIDYEIRKKDGDHTAVFVDLFVDAKVEVPRTVAGRLEYDPKLFTGKFSGLLPTKEEADELEQPDEALDGSEEVESGAEAVPESN